MPRRPIYHNVIPYGIRKLHIVILWNEYLLGKGGYVFGSVDLSVCLSVFCGQHYSKCYERIGMKFYGGVLSSTMKYWLHFGGDLRILRWINGQKKPTIIVVAYPDSGEGNDSFFFFFFFFFFWEGGGEGGVVFHHQGSTFLQWAIWEWWSASAKEVWVLLVIVCD